MQQKRDLEAGDPDPNNGPDSYLDIAVIYVLRGRLLADYYAYAAVSKI